jgi:medium-chain acyl-[acyl-carrier-protein] hydrolase
MSDPKQWLVISEERPAAGLDLYCFPPAGGTSSLYRNWHDGLPPWIEVRAVELPGRERRFSERPFTDMDALLAKLAPLIEGLHASGQRPFVFFGHSMGATIAFELTRRLRERGGIVPRALCLSGRKAPQVPERFPLMYDLDDGPFVEGLRAYGGTPDEVLQNQELMEIFVPLLRADFTLFETWPFRAGPPLPVPFRVFGGAADSRALRSELQAWRIHTAGSFRLRMISGGHFFLRDEADLTLAALAEELAPFAGRLAVPGVSSP